MKRNERNESRPINPNLVVVVVVAVVAFALAGRPPEWPALCERECDTQRRIRGGSELKGIASQFKLLPFHHDERRPPP
jgi:hypothetical protein